MYSKLLTLMPFLQADLNKSRVRAGVGRVDGRKPGVTPMLETMIFRSCRRHDFADRFFPPAFDDFVGQFKARAGRGLEIDDELAGIGSGKVSLPDQRI